MALCGVEGRAIPEKTNVHGSLESHVLIPRKASSALFLLPSLTHEQLQLSLIHI